MTRRSFRPTISARQSIALRPRLPWRHQRIRHRIPVQMRFRHLLMFCGASDARRVIQRIAAPPAPSLRYRSRPVCHLSISSIMFSAFSGVIDAVNHDNYRFSSQFAPARLLHPQVNPLSVSPAVMVNIKNVLIIRSWFIKQLPLSAPDVGYDRSCNDVRAV